MHIFNREYLKALESHRYEINLQWYQQTVSTLGRTTDVVMFYGVSSKEVCLPGIAKSCASNDIALVYWTECQQKVHNRVLIVSDIDVIQQTSMTQIFHGLGGGGGLCFQIQGFTLNEICSAANLATWSIIRVTSGLPLMLTFVSL